MKSMLTFDDIVIHGTVNPIPEPSVALLAGADVVLLLRRRRKCNPVHTAALFPTNCDN